jgi:hypothetical protein
MANSHLYPVYKTETGAPLYLASAVTEGLQDEQSALADQLSYAAAAIEESLGTGMEPYIKAMAGLDYRADMKRGGPGTLPVSAARRTARLAFEYAQLHEVRIADRLAGAGSLQQMFPDLLYSVRRYSSSALIGGTLEKVSHFQRTMHPGSVVSRIGVVYEQPINSDNPRVALCDVSAFDEAIRRALAPHLRRALE